VQKEGTSALPKPVAGGVLPLWERECPTEFFQVELVGSQALGVCLCMKLSASAELGTIFLLQSLHLQLVAVGCSVCETRIFVSPPIDLVSLHAAQICTDFLSL